MSQAEAATMMGVCLKTVRQVEREPWAVKGETLRAYLRLIGWRVIVAKGRDHGEPKQRPWAALQAARRAKWKKRGIPWKWSGIGGRHVPMDADEGLHGEDRG